MKNYIEIDGKKYKVDPDDENKALLDDNGEKVPYEDEGNKDDDDKDKNKDGKNVDLSSMSIEELKKSNPEVAKILKDKEDLDKKIKEKETAEEEANRKRKAEERNWKELAEEESNKRKELENKNTKAEEILGKYKSTVDGILKETLKSIPEDRRNLIPSDYSARKKLEYINNNAKSLGVNIAGAKGAPIKKNDADINLDEESKISKEYNDLLKKGKERTQVESAQMLQLAKKLKEIRKEKEDKK
jgi:hypothetical protein